MDHYYPHISYEKTETVGNVATFTQRLGLGARIQTQGICFQSLCSISPSYTTLSEHVLNEEGVRGAEKEAKSW